MSQDHEKLIELDYAYNITRHITEISAQAFVKKVSSQLSVSSAMDHDVPTDAVVGLCVDVDVAPDIEELDKCIEAIKHLNLFTAMEASTAAFKGLVEDGMDANDLKTVKELIEGDKMKCVMNLASEIQAMSSDCVEKSVQMTSLMQEGYNGLPQLVRTGIDKVADEDVDPELQVDVAPDIEELDKCIDQEHIADSPSTSVQETSTCIEDAPADYNMVNSLSHSRSSFEDMGSRFTTRLDHCLERHEGVFQFSATTVNIWGQTKCTDMTGEGGILFEFTAAVHCHHGYLRSSNTTMLP